MMRCWAHILIVFLATTHTNAAKSPPAQNDLQTPVVEVGEAAPGKRVRVTPPEYRGTELYHALYLPTDWEKGKTYPVIVEYAGNRWKNGPGTVDSCDLGYGISGGQGVIWVCMPYVDAKNKRNAPLWWGNVEVTVEYCKTNVPRICKEFGGDPKNIFIAGFSRGSIACNFIGLHDDQIAKLWRGFICHSHYDGVRPWKYAGADRQSAAKRLKRLGTRPQFISQEGSVAETKKYLAEAHPKGNFSFLSMSFPQHTDTWVLRDCPERRTVRQWFMRVLDSDD